MTNLKQTKTYWIITEKDDLYNQGYFKDQAGQGIRNPTDAPYNNPINAANAPNGRWTFRLPEQFIQSTNRKWIVVQHVLESYTARQNNGVPLANGQLKMTNDVILHSSFVKRDPYVDHAVMLCNEVRTKYKKYEYTSHDPYFEIWFTSFADDQFRFYYGDTKFFIELMLIY